MGKILKNKELDSEKDKHLVLWVNAQKNVDIYGLKGTIEEQLLRSLKRFRKELHKCPSCGGLIPNIKFSFRNEAYYFVCTEITDGKGKTIAETDYSLLEDYCKAKNRNQLKTE